MAALLKEFGPPRKTSPAYPFHHLATDAIWTVSTTSGPGSPGASVTALCSRQASGGLAPDLAESLRAEPLLLSQVAHALLDANFEPSLHEDIPVATVPLLVRAGLVVSFSIPVDVVELMFSGAAIRRCVAGGTSRSDPSSGLGLRYAARDVFGSGYFVFCHGGVGETHGELLPAGPRCRRAVGVRLGRRGAKPAG